MIRQGRRTALVLNIMTVCTLKLSENVLCISVQIGSTLFGRNNSVAHATVVLTLLEPHSGLGDKINSNSTQCVSQMNSNAK